MYKQKIEETQEAIKSKESKLEELNQIVAEFEDSQNRVEQRYKYLSDRESREIDLRSSYDGQDRKYSEITNFDQDMLNYRHNFQNYNYSTLEPVTEVNESRSTINQY